MRYKLGYCASIGEVDILSCMNFAVKNGFNSVEINMNMKCFFLENYTPEDILKINEFKNKHNLILTIHAPDDVCILQLQSDIRRVMMNRLKKIIDFGEKIGAYALTIHVGDTPSITLTNSKMHLCDIYNKEYKKILKRELLNLAKYSENKILVCIENSGYFKENLIQEIYDEIYKDNIYLTWDIGHSYKNKYNELKFFDKHIKNVKVCHLHDANEYNDHLEVGCGNVNFIKHLNKLKEEVIYIFEIRPKEKAVESFEKFKKYFVF